MHEVMLEVGNLCSCKERGLNQTLHKMGVLHSVDLLKGTVWVKYDPDLNYFVEIIEVIESNDCHVMKVMTEEKTEEAEL